MSGGENLLYFLTIVDRFSRYTHAVPIRFKHDGSNELKRRDLFQIFVRNLVRVLVKVTREVRSDNGKEYLNDNFENFLKLRSIRNGLTNPYSSYQNGMAEPRNGLLQEKARCLVTHASVPLNFWPESIRLSAVLLNWQHSRVLAGKTPMEVWHGKVQKQPMFHVFGCLVHAVIPFDQLSHLLLPLDMACVAVSS